VKILIDMNLSPEWVETLEAGGFEAVHWSTVGDPRARDQEILERAKRTNALVFTNDLDFSRILALTGESGPSVVQIRGEDLLPESIGGDVIEALRRHKDVLRSGALMVVDETSLRVRLLPL